MDWVLTAMSKDRPGIVEDIAAIITKHDGNWVKSSMSRLGGEFAGIVQFSVPETNSAALAKELRSLDEKGIQVNVQQDPTGAAPDDQTAKTQGQIAFIELTGIDHKGIVRDITHLLANQGVTIDELETGVFTASMAGEPMFYATAKIRLPVGLSVNGLRDAAETIAHDIMVDINLEIEKDES